MLRLHTLAVTGLVIAAIVIFVAFFVLPGLPGMSPATGADGPTMAGTPAGIPAAAVPLPEVNESRKTPEPTVPPSRSPSLILPTTTARPTVHPISPVETAATGPTPPFPAPVGAAKSDPFTVAPGSLAESIHVLIDRERAAEGLNPLSFDSSLAGIAEGHSTDMAENNYFSHVSPAGLSPTDRGTAAGYNCRKDYASYYTYGIAENIFQNNLYTSVTYYRNGTYSYDWSSPEEIAQTTVGGWMNSSGHRKNILDPTFDREGIGVAVSADDKVYITEDFC